MFPGHWDVFTARLGVGRGHALYLRTGARCLTVGFRSRCPPARGAAARPTGRCCAPCPRAPGRSAWTPCTSPTSAAPSARTVRGPPATRGAPPHAPPPARPAPGTPRPPRTSSPPPPPLRHPKGEWACEPGRVTAHAQVCVGATVGSCAVVRRGSSDRCTTGLTKFFPGEFSFHL